MNGVLAIYLLDRVAVCEETPFLSGVEIFSRE
jgi:hypothetical protein